MICLHHMCITFFGNLATGFRFQHIIGSSELFIGGTADIPNLLVIIIFLRASFGTNSFMDFRSIVNQYMCYVVDNYPQNNSINMLNLCYG